VANRLENCRVPLSARQLFSRNVRKARFAKGLSQEDLAELAGLHRNYIGGVERGERNISIDNMEKLAKALGTTIAKLVPGFLSTAKTPKGTSRGIKG
jgi:transcriptional regulator with XRE-family HTH domain